MKKDSEEKGIRNRCVDLIKIVNIIGSVSISLMMVLITMDILLRNFFGKTSLSPYAFESVELLMVVAIFCSFGWCEINKKNICVDVLFEKLPHTTQKIFNNINYVICFIFCAFMAWRSILQISEIKKTNAAAVFLKIPIYPMQLIVAIGIVLLCIAFFLNLFFPSKMENE